MNNISDKELLSTFENNLNKHVRDAVAEQLNNLSTQEDTEFSEALGESSTDSLEF